MVEKIIHQIWVGDFKIPFREKKLIENIKKLHPDYEHKFWTNPEDLPENIKYWYDKFYNIKNYAFCADVLRIWVVYKYGGFYLDVDFDIKKRLDPFFEFENTFFYHNDTDFTIPNNIFCGKKESLVFKYCVDNIKPECSWYGPSWFGKTVKDYFGFSYESIQEPIKNFLKEKNIEYFNYYQFETTYGKHLSLYSWSPEIWNRLNNDEQL
jgi:mannosyltransferase OCH1-like enzyme